MIFEKLVNLQEHIPLVASWQQAEFGYLNPSVGLEERTENLRLSVLAPKLPMVILALSVEGEPIGAASILATTLTHKHLTPWLSTVVVPPNHRNKGVASALTEQAFLEARAMGFEKLYLFTPKKESLYSRLGWSKFDSVQLRGNEVSVMERNTQAPNPSFHRTASGGR